MSKGASWPFLRSYVTVAVVLAAATRIDLNKEDVPIGIVIITRHVTTLARRVVWRSSK